MAASVIGYARTGSRSSSSIHSGGSPCSRAPCSFEPKAK